MPRQIRVLIADDSATVRHFLAGLINTTPDMTVVGEARDGEEAITLAARLQPDVISMDIQMPRLNGVAATQRLMQETPLPIVIVSGRLKRKESDPTVDLAFLAIQAGALAVLETPPHHNHPTFIESRDHFLGTLRAMAGVSVVRRWGQTGQLPAFLEGSGTEDTAVEPQVIVMGASAGGPMALHRILSTLPADFPVPVAIVQHMADGFIEGLIRWLDGSTALRVMQAEAGQTLLAGQVVIAGSGAHLLLRRSGARVRVDLDTVRGDSPYIPAVDRLFASAAEHFGNRAVGVLLTGMGEDGARGLMQLRDSGARTLVQDQLSCLVFGMPGAAVSLGAAEQIVPLKHIGPTLLDMVQVSSRK